MNDSPLDAKLTTDVIASLNRILELELAGVVRYMHYSFMIFGHNRIPIVAWLRDQGNESNAHAVHGEVNTSRRSVAIPRSRSARCSRPISTTSTRFSKEAHEHEKEGLDAYYSLLELVTVQEHPARGIRARPDRGRGDAPGGYPQDDAQPGSIR